VSAELRRRRGSCVALAALIGCFAGVALASTAGARRTDSAFERFRDEARARDLLVQASVDDLAMADEVAAALGRVKRLPVVAAHTEVALYGGFTDASEEFDRGILSSIDGEFGSTIERPRILAGRWPRTDRPDEVALNEAAAADFAATVGERVALHTLSPEQFEMIVSGQQQFEGDFDGPELQFVVTGVVRFPEDVAADVADVSLFASPAFHEKYAGRVASFGTFLALRLGDPEAADDTTRQIRRLFPRSGTEVLIDTAAVGTEQVGDAIRVLTVALLLIALSVALAGAIAGTQALNRQLQGLAGHQVTLAALGMTRRQRILATMWFAAPVAAGAAAVAVLVAVAASPLFPINLARRAEPDPGLHADWVVLGAGVAVVVVVVLAAATVRGWKFTRETRLGAGSAARPRPGFAARVAARLRLGPSGAAGIGIASAPGSSPAAVPFRPALVGSIVGLASVVAAIVFAASLGRLTTEPARYGIPWDLATDLAVEQAREVAARDDIGDLAVLVTANVVVEGDEAQGYALDVEKGDASFSMLEGRPPSDAAEIALGPDQLTRLNVTIGDRVSLLDTSGQPRRLEVVGRVLVPDTNDYAFTAGAVLTPDGLDQVRQSDGARQVVVNWRSGVDTAAARARLQRDYPYALSAYSRPGAPKEIANLARVKQLPWILAALLAVIGLAAIGHFLVTTVRRHGRDLAVLRSLGFTRRQVAATAHWQATILVLVAIAVGAPIGLLLGRWTWSVVAGVHGVAQDVSIPLVPLLFLVPATLVVANVVAALPARAAGRVAPSNALRTE
jgi:hypothetical protein